MRAFGAFPLFICWSIAILLCGPASAADHAAITAVRLRQDLTSAKLGDVIKALEDLGATKIQREEVRLLPNERTSDEARNAFLLRLKKLSQAAEWLGMEFTIRLTPPPTMPEVQFVEVSYCPATGAVSDLRIRFSSKVATIDEYASITSAMGEAIGRHPDEIADLAPSGLVSVWRSKSAERAASSWSPGSETPVQVAYYGTDEASACHRQFSLAKAKESSRATE